VKGIDANGAFEQLLHEHGLAREKLTFYAPMFAARLTPDFAFKRRRGISRPNGSG